MQEKRVTFYIDGFNFYFGLLRSMKSNPDWQNAYWIDMVKLCESFLGENQKLEKVIYFTAAPLNQEKSSRQSSFLNANKLINKNRFEVVRGKYIEKNIVCPFCNATISRPEEKKTDVNISIRMIEDCVLNKTDSVCLVSADSDLIPPLELIKKDFQEKSIKVYFPPSNSSNDIKDALWVWRKKPVYMMKNINRFIGAIMSDTVSDGTSTYTIPQKWKELQNL